SKEAATPSGAWKVLESAKPEALLFLQVTARDQNVVQKLRNFFGKWRQVRQKLPLPEMAEMHITPALPAYSKIEQEAFYLLLDGKLRSRTEIQKFLKPYAPPPPPPPPPPPAKRGRAAKAGAAKAEAAARPQAAAAAGTKPGAAPAGTPALPPGRKKEGGRSAAAVADAVAAKVATALHAKSGNSHPAAKPNSASPKTAHSSKAASKKSKPPHKTKRR